VNHADLKLQFQESASLRLLRAENAPLALAVLFAAFKREHVPSVNESRLRAILEAELEELRDAGGPISDKAAKSYLVEWTDQFHGYLWRHQPDSEDEPVYELTPEIELVFQWLEMLKPKTHVGTESKFKNLVATLKEIVENSTGEADVRIERLKRERLRLQQEIEEIEQTGNVNIYNATQVNERFASLLEMARKLLGDFREVERHFRRVTENISVQHSSAETRGTIVGRTLDAQEQLRESSQGQSFYAFWDFLLAPERRREFSELTEVAYALPTLADELRNDVLLRKLQFSLRTEGNKVVSSNERLVAQLRRVLDVRQSAERREVGRLIQEIKALAYRTRDSPPQSELIEVDTKVSLSSLMSKAQWAPPMSVEFGGGLRVSEGGDYRETLAAFLRLHPIDFERLRKNIRDCLQTRVQIALPEVLALFPPRNGVLEVLAYLLIADSDGPHVVFESFDFVELPGEARLFRVPQIIFSNT
jgi:hypothetical protein